MISDTFWVAALAIAILGANLWHAWWLDRKHQTERSER